VKILLLDIETAPNVAYVWGLWQQNVAVDQIQNSGYVMCWSAKWYDEPKIRFDSLYQSTERGMLRGIHKLLDEADIAVHYNGAKFDIPTLNKEFVLKGMKPPAPYRQVDLYRVVRDAFRFPSNKLDYVSQALGLARKVRHRGFQLWVDCMAKEARAWREMEKYNRQDVVVLEQLYDRLKPWITSHPNHGAYDDGAVCPKCGSVRHQRRGEQVTTTLRYARYQCLDCGGWFRSVLMLRGNRARYKSIANG
jgi:DNA polymerase elongation subunit (family B)